MDFAWGNATHDTDFVDQEDETPPLAIEDGSLSDEETPTTQPEQSPDHEDPYAPGSSGALDMMEASQGMEPEEEPNDTPNFHDPTSDADLENPYMGPLPDSVDPMCVADPTWTDSQPEYDDSEGAKYQSHDTTKPVPEAVNPSGAPDAKTDAASMPPPPPLSGERVAKRRREIEEKIKETRLGSKIITN